MSKSSAFVFISAALLLAVTPASASEIFLQQASVKGGAHERTSRIANLLSTPISPSHVQASNLPAALANSNSLDQNIARVSQVGSQNQAIVAQQGNGNYALIAQRGQGNFASVTQSVPRR